MRIAQGVIFSGKYFTGKVEVLEVKEDSNEVEVQLWHKQYPTGDDSWWFETWNLQHTKWGFERGEYFNIPLTQK